MQIARTARASPNDAVCRLSEIARAVDVNRLSVCRILFGLVDLQHGAIADQLGLRRVNYMCDRNRIGDIELAMFERQDFMLMRQPLRQMAADQSRRASNENLHRSRL